MEVVKFGEFEEVKVRDLVSEVNSITKEHCQTPQEVFTMEECSELIKELAKNLRGKGDREKVVDEACDVLTSVFILLTNMEVHESEVRIKIILKCKRTIKRFNEHGVF